MSINFKLGSTFEGIRKRILLPFLLIVSVMTVSTMVLSVYFISDLASRYLANELTKHQNFMATKLNEQLDRSVFYAQFAAKLNRYAISKSQGADSQAIRQVPQQMLAWDNMSLYWKVIDSSFSLREIQSVLEKVQKKPIQNHVLISSLNAQKMVHILAIAGPLWAPVITEFHLNAAFLDPIDKLSHAKSAVVWIDQNEVQMVALSTHFSQFPEFKRQVLAQIWQWKHKKKSTNIVSFRWENTWYKMRVTPLSLHPNLYLVAAMPVSDIRNTTGKIIAVSILLLIGVNVLIGITYFSIVRRITRSIDTLSQAAQEISKGHWEQRIDIPKEDEMGTLAQAFNQMTEGLLAYREGLMTEKSRLEAILACVPEGIIVTDSQNRLILANRRAEGVFNFSSDQIQGKILMEHISNADLITNLKQKFEGETREITREVAIPDSYGRNRVYVLTSNLVINANGQHIGAITMLRDVTRDKELEELRDGFLRTVTHELRTPLTSIIGFIELVCKSETPLPAQKQELLMVAFNEATNLKNLIDDLLDLSRFKAGRVKMMSSSIRVADLLNSLVISFGPLAKGKNLELTVASVDPGLVVKADMGKLRRVLVNLISNAIKFTHVGGIKLGCIDEEARVVFYVEDSGIGLMENETEVIFDKFRQIDYSSTRKYEGIGLGLSLVKQLVEMHGGEVWVKSTHGKGSTFYFSMPKLLG